MPSLEKAVGLWQLKSRRCCYRYMGPLMLVGLVAGGCSQPPNTAALRLPSSKAVEKPAQSVSSPQKRAVDSRRLASNGNRPVDKYMRAADDAFAAGQYLQALNAYRDAQRLAPQEPAATIGTIRSTLATQGVPEGVNAAPGNPTALACVEELKKLSRQHPDYYVAWLELGRVYLILGEAGMAESSLGRANALEPNDPEVASGLGISLLLGGNADGALPFLQKAAELDPETASRHANLGTVQLQTKRLAAAIRSYRRAIELQPASAEVQTSLGTALLQAGDFSMALQHLREALRLDPQRATSHNNLGFAYMMAKHCSQAQARFKEAIRLDPKLGSAWINAAICHAKSGDLVAAREALARALALDPDDPRAQAVDRELRQLEHANPKSKVPPTR